MARRYWARMWCIVGMVVIAMRIGVPKEIQPGETRVALVPEAARQLIRAGHEVLVEANAGTGSMLADDAYVQSGATVMPDVRSIYGVADVIFKVEPPQVHSITGLDEAQMVRKGTIYIGFLAPWTRPDVVATFARRQVTAYAMELVPRIARAQSMDALTSMATISGYKAVLLATEHLGKMLPLLMTAAGTIPPARVLVLGVGVAGLQAIATAKRLGARVDAFDPRPAVAEQIESLGATFLAMPVTENVEAAGGYAREQKESFLHEEREVIDSRLSESDVVICAAQVFGKRAPILLTAEMVRHLRPGSVVIDLAADQGGNCALTRSGETVMEDGITIVGALNVPALLPVDASRLYANNLVSLFRYLYPDPGTQPESTDVIASAVCVTRRGAIVNEALRAVVEATAPTTAHVVEEEVTR